MSHRRCFALAQAAGLLLTGRAAFGADEPSKIFLHKDWQIQSSCEAKANGAEISTTGFDAKGWHHSDIPSTVVGALVTDETYPDPDYGTNLRTFPGFNDDPQHFFSNLDMPKGSPFRCALWFRTEFSAPAEAEHKTNWLNFLGINYRANVWLNGQKIADANEVSGTFATFEFNVSKALHPGKNNALAVEIFAPGKNDLGITWVDWNPTPPDKDMGIWKEVFLRSSGDVSLRNPFVSSKLDTDYKNAALAVSADLRNVSNRAVNGVFRAEVDGKQVSQQVSLNAGEAKTVSFAPEQYAELRLENARLWWPYTMGDQNLYTVKLSFDISNETSDSSTITFGVREVTSELTDKGYRLFKINGRRILIRGAAWAPDLLLRWSSKRVDADLNYVRDMGLNTIRLEGRIDREGFYEKTDRLGILVMPGWTCCDAWEQWGNWKEEHHKIAAESLRSQIRILRNHPSIFVWLYGSDGPPPADVEKMYLAILKELQWPNPSVSSASATPTTVTGESGVKMTGPYEYVPPVYWLADTTAGGAYGYNTETSPGPAIPTLESVKRFIPKEHLWPMDDVWNYHAGGERFTTVNVFTDGLNKRYGTATSLEDYERKAQAVAYDGERAMFESYGRNKYVSTGVIQWMLNNAWPSLIWHLYDYYLVPGGGYFGTKKAMEPLHVQYGYDDQGVAVVNDTYQERNGMKVRARVYSIDAKLLADKEETVDIPADAAVKAFDLPKPDGLTMTFFVKLSLRDARGKNVSDNFYRLSAKADTLDWAHKQDTVYTPQAEFGDLTGLNSLPQVKLQTSALLDQKAGAATGKAHVRVKNTSSSVAFQIRLRLADKKYDHDVVPVFWEDNYFSLLPGEERIISVSYNASELHGTHPVIQVGGFNIAAGEVPVQTSPTP